MYLKLGERLVTCSCTNGVTDRKNKLQLGSKSSRYHLFWNSENFWFLSSQRWHRIWFPHCPPLDRRVKLLLFSPSFIATFFIFCSCYYYYYYLLFIPTNTKSISKPTEGVFAPNQQRCSRVLNPLALLFLPLLPWSSRCHFATVAAAQIPDLPRDLTPFPHRAEGCAQQSPPAIR